MDRNLLRYIPFFLLFSLLVLFCKCGKGKAETTDNYSVAAINKKERKPRFTGNYSREFNDLQELHMVAALSNGIKPMDTKADTALLAEKLVRLPDELELYKTYELKHSVPFLVPSAAQLVIDISRNFRDSLYSKQLPMYKLYLTSITRTNEDVGNLTRRNINASENSTHCYGTTVDISWKRFCEVDPDTVNQLPPERLKLVLAQVLFDLRNQQRCYVKHERKQACFHITVR